MDSLLLCVWEQMIIDLEERAPAGQVVLAIIEQDPRQNLYLENFWLSSFYQPYRGRNLYEHTYVVFVTNVQAEVFTI